MGQDFWPKPPSAGAVPLSGPIRVVDALAITEPASGKHSQVLAKDSLGALSFDLRSE